MKIFLRIILIMIPLFSNAQFDFEDNDWEKKTIGFGCGYGGTMTDMTVQFHYLFANKDFEGIKAKLDSNILGERFLSAYTLLKLEKKKELSLDKQLLNKIENIKQITDTVSVCSGCTYWKTVPLNELWNKKHPIFKAAESWFKFYFKMNYRKE